MGGAWSCCNLWTMNQKSIFFLVTKAENCHFMLYYATVTVKGFTAFSIPTCPHELPTFLLVNLKPISELLRSIKCLRRAHRQMSKRSHRLAYVLQSFWNCLLRFANSLKTQNGYIFNLSVVGKKKITLSDLIFNRSIC